MSYYYEDANYCSGGYLLGKRQVVVVTVEIVNLEGGIMRGSQTIENQKLFVGVCCQEFMVWLGFVDVMVVVVIVVVAVAMVIVVVVMVSNSAEAASHKLRQMIVLQHLSCQHF